MYEKKTAKLIHSGGSQTSPCIRISYLILEVLMLRLQPIPVKYLRLETSHPYFLKPLATLIPMCSQVWGQSSELATCGADCGLTAQVISASLSEMQCPWLLPRPTDSEYDLDQYFPNFTVPSNNLGIFVKRKIWIQLLSHRA